MGGDIQVQAKQNFPIHFNSNQVRLQLLSLSEHFVNV